MMEVTPHLKSVLKNYQNSATKSLQGPGLSLTTTASLATKNEPPSPEPKEDDYIPAAPFPVQQLPILTTPDTSCSDRTETIVEGQTISCFVVGGERRLCLPQVLNSVLREFTLHQINQECDQLQIYCSRCTSEQLNVLKTHSILPPTANSSGLITKTDAERLCSALLYGGTANGGNGAVANPILPRPRKGAASFSVYHKCFGKCMGLCFPELFTSKSAKCIECSECQGGFSPQQFVCHVHRHFSEYRTVHWGFDSANWRAYLKVCKDQNDQEQCIKYLDEMSEQYEGKVPYPLPQNIYSHIKRKQILTSDLIKERDLPLKKQKIVDDFMGVSHAIPFGSIYETLGPLYIHQYFQECNANRHLSAFKPVNHHTIKESSKIYHHLMGGMGLNRYGTDPPVLQNPDRVVLMSESERFERTFQPNVALAPNLPKKHRYMKTIPPPSSTIKEEIVMPTIKEELVHIKQEIEEDHKPLPENNNVPKSVSVVQTLPRYNSEIELSTDTEDSASDTSCEKTDLTKVREMLNDVANLELREKILKAFRGLFKEREKLVEEALSQTERMREMEQEMKKMQQNEQRINERLKRFEKVQASPEGMEVEEEEEEQTVVCNGKDNDDDNDNDEISSSIIKTKDEQASVIVDGATEEPKAIINTAPE